MPRGTFPECCCQCPCPCGEPLLTHTSTGDPPTPAGSFGSVFCGVTAPFLSFGGHKVLFMPSKIGVSLSPSPMEVLLSNPTGLQGQIPWGFLVPLLDPQAGKPDIGFRTFITVEHFFGIIVIQFVGHPLGGYGI